MHLLVKGQLTRRKDRVRSFRINCGVFRYRAKGGAFRHSLGRCKPLKNQSDQHA
jgi:hypothetical protein